MEFVGGVEFVQGGLDVWALITQNLLKKFLVSCVILLGDPLGRGIFMRILRIDYQANS